MTQGSDSGIIRSAGEDIVTPSLVAAVFDVDRTLVPVTTTERIFIRYLLRRGVLRWNALLAITLLVLRSLPARVSPFEAMRRERAYLAGQPYAKIRRLAHDCFDTGIKPRISRAGLEAISEHKAKGEVVVLLTGSLDFLMEPFKEYVGADHLIAAKMEVVDGKLTGRIVGDWPYGSYKAVLIRHFAQEHGLDFTRSSAYADHHTDHEVLRLFGNPVVINARTKMQEIARREGWTMRDFG
ncbi:MAG: haloacid dehalogenase-like hydrolase [Chloroflexota bacterium]|nr:haloacid dehalogenase-like hydrolase [Chloroflexota bacterium]